MTMIAIIGGLAFLMIWLALIKPSSPRQGQAAGGDAYTRLSGLDGLPVGRRLLRSMADEVTAWFLKPGPDGKPRTINARYLQQLKQANWYWDMNEVSPPNPRAPFWNLSTLWGNKALYAILIGGAMGAALSLVAMVIGIPPILGGAAGALLGGLTGWASPDDRLKRAVAGRQYHMIIEMGFRVPELAAMVTSGRSLRAAMSDLARRSGGGPFVTEVRRIMKFYDINADWRPGLNETIERNRFQPLSEFCRQVLMVTSRGGSIGPALVVLGQSAQEALRRRLEAQGLANARAMVLPVSLGGTGAIFLLIAGPVLWLVLTSLSGGY